MFIVALSSALESPFHILELQVATIRYMSIIGRTFLCWNLSQSSLSSQISL